MDNLLKVRVGNDIYGLNTDKIEQIIKVGDITPIPLAGKEILGVCVLLGKVFNVIDLSMIVEKKPINIKKDSARLLTIPSSQTAICVDEVLNMISVDMDNYEENEDKDSIVMGFYREDNEIIQVLDYDRLINDVSLISFKPKEITKIEEEDKKNANAKDEQDVRRFLFFRIGAENYAIDIEFLNEIIFVPNDITSVADSDAMGVFKLRDNVITLLNGNELFGFDNEDISAKSRVLVLRNRNSYAALLVSEVYDIKDIDMSAAEPIPENFENNKLEAMYTEKNSIFSIISGNYLRDLINRYSINNASEAKENLDLSKEGVMSEIVVFKIYTEEYAFDIEEVQEIIAYEDVTPIPDAPEFVKGVLNLRGSVVPIISLPDRLGFNSDITTKTKIIVCMLGNSRVGFIVDDVNEILFVEDKYISEVTQSDSIFNQIINLNDGERIILKINIASLISEEELSTIQDNNINNS